MRIFYYGSFNLELLKYDSIHNYEILKNLSVIGHEIIPLDGTFNTPNKNSANKNYYGQKRISSSVLNRSILIPFIFEIICLLKGVRLLLNMKKPEILYMRHSLFGGGYYLGKFFKIPVVKEINGVISDEVNAATKNMIVRGLVSFFEDINIKKAEKYIAVTPMLKEILINDYEIDPSKVEVLENGANVELFQPMDIDESKSKVLLNKEFDYVCFIGGFWKTQGLDTLINAVPLVLKSIPNVRFLLVGDGPMKEEILRICETLHITENVILPGVVPYNEVPHFINSSRLCVAPFISERNNRIGLSPLKINEYAACGKPIITSRILNLEFIEINKMGILVKPENPEELALSIITLLNDKELSESMGKNSRAFALSHRSWKLIATKFSHILENCLRSKNY